MPSGTEPPILKMPQGVFNALSLLSYDSDNMAFKTDTGALYFLFGEKQIGGLHDQAEWFYATDSEGGSNPKAMIPQITATVILNGTYNSSDGTITYQSQPYRIRLMRDTGTGNQLAQAFALS